MRLVSLVGMSPDSPKAGTELASGLVFMVIDNFYVFIYLSCLLEKKKIVKINFTPTLLQAKVIYVGGGEKIGVSSWIWC